MPHGAQRPVPDAPRGLLPSTRRLWTTLWTSGIAAHWRPDSQLHVLERYIRAVDSVERLPEEDRGTVRELRLLRTVQFVEDRFGLSPMSELRLGLLGVRGALTAAQLNAMTEDDATVIDGELLDEFEAAQ